MKTFIQYIKESRISDSPNSVAEFVKSNCKEFYEEFGDWFKAGYFFYRGMHEVSNKNVLTVKKDRAPKDSDIITHTLTDDWFYKKFGNRFRSQAIFSYMSPDMVASYGDPYIIFPIGSYDFCSSTEIKDLYSDLFTREDTPNNYDMFIQVERKYREKYPWLSGIENIEDPNDENWEGEVNFGYIDKLLRSKYNEIFIDLLMNMCDYFKNDKEKLSYNRDSGMYEIMIDCKEYFVVPYTSNEKNLQKAFRDNG